jgi:hypothetical protein
MVKKKTCSSTERAAINDLLLIWEAWKVFQIMVECIKEIGWLRNDEN